VYFGYPRAHEDDAERATRASIALKKPWETSREHAVALEVRSAFQRPRRGRRTDRRRRGRASAASSEIRRISPRGLQNLAEPDTVVVSESTTKAAWQDI